MNSPKSSDTDALASTLEDRIRNVENSTERELIRRETRWVHVCLNLLSHFGLRELRQDTNARAATTAFLWRLFSPGTAAAGGGIIILALTAIQAGLLFRQEEKLDQQTHLMQAQTNVVLGAQLGPLLEALAQHTESVCIDKALYDRLDENYAKRCWSDTKNTVERKVWFSCKLHQLDPSWRKGSNKFTCPFEQDPPGSEYNAYLLDIPSSLPLRTVAFTRTLQPYRFIENDSLPKASAAHKSISTLQSYLDNILPGSESPRLVTRPLSPEKGVLLAQMIRMGYRFEQSHDYDFRATYAFEMRASGSTLHTIRESSFPYGNFRDVVVDTLEESDFVCAAFSYSTIRRLVGGNYYGADFSDAKLPVVQFFSPSILTHANFTNAIVHEEDFVQKVAAKGIPGFDASAWQVQKNKRSGDTNCGRQGVRCYIVMAAKTNGNSSREKSGCKRD